MQIDGLFELAKYLYDELRKRENFMMVLHDVKKSLKQVKKKNCKSYLFFSLNSRTYVSGIFQKNLNT